MAEGTTHEQQHNIMDQVNAVLKTNNEELMKNIVGMISQISSSSYPLPTKTDIEKPNFKRKSNEEQHKLNAKVLDKMQSANEYITSNQIEAAKEALSDGKLNFYLFVTHSVMYVTKFSNH
ncbi:hypothetical protein ACF0H5_012268 [Mactra antiquata]